MCSVFEHYVYYNNINPSYKLPLLHVIQQTVRRLTSLHRLSEVSYLFPTWSSKHFVATCDLVIARRSSHLWASWALPSIWLLFLLAGDIELNPGPRHWKYLVRFVQDQSKQSMRHAVRCVCLLAPHKMHWPVIGGIHRDTALRCSKCLKESLPFFDVSNSDSIFNTSDSIFNTSTADSLGNTDPTTSTSLHPPHSLTVFYTNCRSLLPKIDHIRLNSCFSPSASHNHIIL